MANTFASDVEDLDKDNVRCFAHLNEDGYNWVEVDLNYLLGNFPECCSEFLDPVYLTHDQIKSGDFSYNDLTEIVDELGESCLALGNELLIRKERENIYSKYKENIIKMLNHYDNSLNALTNGDCKLSMFVCGYQKDTDYVSGSHHTKLNITKEKLGEIIRCCEARDKCHEMCFNVTTREERSLSHDNTVKLTDEEIAQILDTIDKDIKDLTDKHRALQTPKITLNSELAAGNVPMLPNGWLRKKILPWVVSDYIQGVKDTIKDPDNVDEVFTLLENLQGQAETIEKLIAKYL